MAAESSPASKKRASVAAAAAGTPGVPVATAACAPIDDTAARVRAALPAGVDYKLLDGPWMLASTDVVFDVSATGGRRVLTCTADAVVYAGTLYDEPATIEQAHPATADDINAWLARVRFQYGVRAEGVLPVYGALIDVDGTSGAPAFYTVAQRAAGSLVSVVLAPDGALAHASVTARLRLVWQAAGALAALHARHIVHGAVTPANVLLSSTNEGEAAVRVVGYNTCTRTGAAEGAAGDVHGWGTLAWHVLTGATPTPVADGPPPTAALVERGVPAAVVDAIRECLASDPEARPAMAAVARTLAAALATLRAAAAASRPAPGQPQSALAVAARDSMLQLAVRAAMSDDAEELERGGSVAAATLRTFVADVAVVRAACVALQNLAWRCGAETAEQLQKDGVGAALVAALLTHTNDVEVLHAACGALTSLAVYEPVRRLLVQGDGVGGALAAALCSDAAGMTVARTVCAALSHLAAAADNALVLQRGGCGAAVIAALRRYNNDAEVAAAACGTLQHLAFVEANRCDLVRGDAGTAAVAALQQHVGDADVARSVCSVLCYLAASMDSREALLARVCGSVGAAVAAVLKHHTDNASVTHAAMRALQNLGVCSR